MEQQISRQVRFQKHYKQQVEEIRKQVAVYAGGTIVAYKGNTTGLRARKQIRKFAREGARQLMREEALEIV